MAISRNRASIIDAFIGGRSLSNYRNFSTDGSKLWSYSTLIAYRDDDGSMVVRDFKYSRTTTRQLSDLRWKLDKAGVCYKTSKPMHPYWYLHNIVWSTPV